MGLKKGRRSKGLIVRTDVYYSSSEVRKLVRLATKWVFGMSLASALLANTISAQIVSDPALTLSLNPDHSLQISWFDSMTPLVLEDTPSLALGNWLPVDGTPTKMDDRLSLTVSPIPERRFYRLRVSTFTLSATTPSFGAR